MTSYRGTLRCEACNHEIDVYGSIGGISLTLEHHSKREHSLMIREPAFVIEAPTPAMPTLAEVKRLG